MAIDPAKPYDLRFVVDPAQAGRRLDCFVRSRVPSMSRTRVQRYIARDRVWLNDTPRRARVRVRTGDHVRLCCRDPLDDGIPSPGHTENGAPPPPPRQDHRTPAERDRAASHQLDVVYEDDAVVAVNKPAGMLAHPVGRERHGTLMNLLYWRYAAPSDASGHGDDADPDDGRRIDLVNRLDRDTSGVVLAGKTREAKQRLQEAFEARQPEKTYWALCEGWIPQDAGTVDAPLGPDGTSDDHCRMAVRRDGAGKSSLTRYWVVRRFAVRTPDRPDGIDTANSPGIPTEGGVDTAAAGRRDREGTEENVPAPRPDGADASDGINKSAATPPFPFPTHKPSPPSADAPDALHASSDETPRIHRNVNAFATASGLESQAVVDAALEGLSAPHPEPGAEPLDDMPSVPWAWKPDAAPGWVRRSPTRGTASTDRPLRPHPRADERLGARVPWHESRVRVKPHRRRGADDGPRVHTAYAGGRALPPSRYQHALEEAGRARAAVEGFTLVRLAPVTGRQHQLRVHMAEIGHPLVADARYGRSRALAVRRADGTVARLDRFALHAGTLTFPHPEDGRTVEVAAPWASDFAGVVEGLSEGGAAYFVPYLHPAAPWNTGS